MTVKSYVWSRGFGEYFLKIFWIFLFYCILEIFLVWLLRLIDSTYRQNPDLNFVTVNLPGTAWFEKSFADVILNPHAIERSRPCESANPVTKGTHCVCAPLSFLWVWVNNNGISNSMFFLHVHMYINQYLTSYHKNLIYIPETDLSVLKKYTSWYPVNVFLERDAYFSISKRPWDRKISSLHI